jgi:hypothetical protein
MNKTCIALGALAVAFLVGFADVDPKKITIPPILLDQFKTFEPSAVLFISETGQFLIVSDDTNKADEPILFSMNSKGEVDSSISRVTGLPKMADIESMSQDEAGRIYLLSSQSLAKKDKDSVSRQLFVRASRSKNSYVLTDSIVLRPLILQAIEASKDPVLSRLAPLTRQELDVEAHFVRKGILYLALKSPMLEDHSSVILSLGKVDDIFSLNQIDLKHWKTISIPDLNGKKNRISDFVLANDLFLITTSSKNNSGGLWQYEEQSEKLKLIRAYPQHKPEGVAYVETTKSALVVFDKGANEAHFVIEHNIFK